jgi:hypothetical protein
MHEVQLVFELKQFAHGVVHGEHVDELTFP